MLKSIITSLLSVISLAVGVSGVILSLDIAPLPGESHTFWSVLLFSGLFIFSLVIICLSIVATAENTSDTYHLITKGR